MIRTWDLGQGRLVPQRWYGRRSAQYGGVYVQGVSGRGLCAASVSAGAAARGVPKELSNFDLKPSNGRRLLFKRV